VPEPRISAIGDVTRIGMWLFPDLRDPERMVVEVPTEVYLRQFRDTPADDLDALTELCKLGLIRSLNTAKRYHDLPIDTDEQWEHVLDDLYRFWPGIGGWYGDEKERDEVWGEAQRQGSRVSRSMRPRSR
jgi:hypothetical protein